MAQLRCAVSSGCPTFTFYVDFFYFVLFYVIFFCVENDMFSYAILFLVPFFFFSSPPKDLLLLRLNQILYYLYSVMKI